MDDDAPIVLLTVKWSLVGQVDQREVIESAGTAGDQGEDEGGLLEAAEAAGVVQDQFEELILVSISPFSGFLAARHLICRQRERIGFRALLQQTRPKYQGPPVPQQSKVCSFWARGKKGVTVSFGYFNQP